MKLAALFLVLSLTGICESLITKAGKGYSGIVVAIHNSVPEDTQLIEKIKTIFQNASSLLFHATSNQAFFKEVTIVVPDAWTNQPHYEKVYGEYYQNADVRIANRTQAYGDIPYTLQNGDCGQPGEYIHLTPNYINTVTSGKEHIYGPTDRLIVHEWAHLRYGVFDEYGTPGDPDFPIFHLRDKKVRVSACSEDIQGWIESMDGAPCEIDKHDVVSSNCRFVPDTSNASVVASLMSFNYLPSVTEFCEKSANGARKHNGLAPTKQNRFCDRSAWEVITNHRDFESMNSLNDEPFFPTTFKIARSSTEEQRYVLVLDISGSMTGKRLNLMRQATIKLIEDTIPKDSYVGIVTYESTARIVQPLIKITDQNRKAVSAKVPNRANGGTAIGLGLQEALKVIRNSQQPTEGAVLILVTDGEENVTPYINTVLPEVIAAKVKVYAIAFGKDATLRLEGLTRDTGKSFLFDDNDVLTTHLDGIFEQTVDHQIGVDFQKEELTREPVSASSTVEKTVQIDNELGKNTVFTVSGQIVNVQLEATGPKGEHFNHASTGYNKDTGIKSRIQLHLPFAEPGIWTLKLVKSDASTSKMDISVTSEPRNPDVQPVRVMTHLGDPQVKYPATGRIYARVTKGAKIVIRATVIATIQRPASYPVDVVLLDDGAGADRQKDDGLYSAYFTQYTSNGRYSISVTVTNDGDALVVNPKFSGISPLPINAQSAKRLNKDPTNQFDLSLFRRISEEKIIDVFVESEPLGNVSRTNDVGTIVLSEHDPKVDKMPPNKVTDLRVIGSEVTKTGDRIFILEWTSPGDNMDHGTAASLEIRVSIHGNDLRGDHFNSSFLLNQTHLLEGSLIPLPGKTTQRIVVKLSEQWILQVIQSSQKTFDVYIALRATDAAKNVAEISNLVSVHFGYEIPVLVVPTVPPTTEPEIRREVKCKRRLVKNKLLLSLVVDMDNFRNIESLEDESINEELIKQLE